MSSGRSHQSALADGYGELHRRELFLPHPTCVPKSGVHYGGYRLKPAGKTSTCGCFGKKAASAVPYSSNFDVGAAQSRILLQTD
jgi:hypothetical protein